MMRKILLALALAALGTPAWAVCPTPLTGKDAAGTTQNFGVTVDGSGNCYGNVGIVDGTNAANKAAVTAAGADTVSNSTSGLQGYNFPFWFNGTTWDRARGDATNGAFVNVKTSVLPTGAATAANQAIVTTWGGGTLGAMANYGSNPGSVLVPGVNAATAPSAYLTTLSGWTSGTAGNATQPLMASGGWPAITVQLNQTSTISGGAVTFEGTYDGTNWVTVPVAQVLNPSTLANLTNPYTLVQSTNQPFLILTQGYQQVRVRLSTVITGSGTVTPFVALQSTNPVLGGLLSPIVWPTTVPPVKIDQTTFGTTNGVVSAANTYNTVAASQTTQAMTGGGGGAAGDYLSHCVVTPGTTSPGVVTVLDNASAIISFAGGASSISNLVPFALPVGAKSTSGAWKITTGANVTVVCVGKFT